MSYFKLISFVFILLFIFLIGYFFIGSAKPAEEIKWGINFSQKHSENLGLDWKDVYLSFLDNLGVKRLRVSVDWDMIEPRRGEYYFNDLDWQIKKAEERGAKIILVIGIKTLRWPECHQPNWAYSLTSKEREQALFSYLKEIINRYRNSKAVFAWQVENELFFPFGDCPKVSKGFFAREVELVRELDSSRPIITSGSGEVSLFLKTGKYVDMIGITMYRKVWFDIIKSYVNYNYFLSSTFYYKKNKLIKFLFHKPIICIELQAEPWGPVLLYDLPLEEQKKTMDLDKFKKVIEFAQETGMDEFYLWGGEWWYWMKEKQSQPQFWQEAKKLFRQ